MNPATYEVRTIIDDEPATLHVHATESAVHAIRSLGHTGCKLACGQGACGACTIQLDGEPVVSCLLPATSLHGRRVLTVRGLGKLGLHPVQRAFLAHDALQCGYCTPGFLVRAARFVDEHRGERPDRESIAAALAGHLCRCGAYEQIYTAVAAACAGEHDDDTRPPPRHDALAKVRGDAQYPVDVRYEGMLEGRILRSTYASAQMTHLNLAPALAIPGVVAAVELMTKGRIVRYAGQEIAAIAAVDAETAARGLAAIEVHVEPRPFVLDMDAARKDGAPVVYPERSSRREVLNASEGPLPPLTWAGNLRGPFWFLSSGIRKARRILDQAPHGSGSTLVEGTYRTQVQCHNCLEPHAAVACFADDGSLTVWLSTQAVARMAKDIAKRFSLRLDQVQVRTEYVGGAFGSKATLTAETIAAIELARRAKAPVRMVLDRREELEVGGTRPAAELHLRVATTPAGELAAIGLRAYGDAGVAVGHVTSALVRIMYADAPRDLMDYDVTTNTSPGKPLRGPGGPPAFWALESTLDEIAHRRGEDPIALRRRIDPNTVRRRLYDWVESLEVWRHRGPGGQDRGRFRRGVGFAAGGWFYFTQPSTRVEVTVGPEGIVARTASQDIGNGTRTVIADSIAAVFGMHGSEVVVELGNSSFVEGPFSGGSRTTASVVPAAEDAAMGLRDDVTKATVTALGLHDARAEAQGIVHQRGVIPWREAFRTTGSRTRVGQRKSDRGGYFLPFRIEGIAIGRYLGVSVQVTQVEVDTRLGKVRPLEVWAGVGVGRIVSPVLARSQVQGGVIQGIGYTLYEERRLDPWTGRLLSASLDDYRIPGIGDIPPIHVHFDEGGFENVQSGTVGLGEVVAMAPPPSIGNAIAHATGWRPRVLPIRPDRVLQGVQS